MSNKYGSVQSFYLNFTEEFFYIYEILVIYSCFIIIDPLLYPFNQ